MKVTIQEYQARLDSLRVEFEAVLNVLTARVSTANDYEDWTTIRDQSRQLCNIADKAKHFAWAVESEEKRK
jgi:hypothetical protein